MPVHRIALRDSADIIAAGASPNTVGIGAVRNKVSTRAVGADIPAVSVDGSTTFDLPMGKYTSKTIVDGSATALFDFAVASGAMAGGVAFYTVEASDGTDFQTMSGMITYSAVNKAGSVTASAIGYVTGNDSKSVSSGTLTLAWTNVAGTLKSTVKLQPTGSLTETTPYRVTLFILPIQGGLITLL